MPGCPGCPVSWEIIGEERGLRQVAYQVLVATSLENLCKRTKAMVGIPAK